VRDWAEVAARVEAFIRQSAERLRRDGALLGLSGGLDSTTTACLCAHALGKERVVGLIMPEKEGAPEVVDEARAAADFLGIRAQVVDITPQLEALGVYEFPLSRIPTHYLRAATVRLASGIYAARNRARPFLASLAGGAGGLLAASSAHFRVKHRVRMATAAFYAERHNLLLVGAATKTEKLTGIFVKFGIDHCADIMPIAPLYRSEVLQLAAHLGVPENIRGKPPDPGVIPGVRDKYRFLLGLDSEVVDAALQQLVSGTPPAEVARRLHVPSRKIERLSALIAATWHMRNPSLEPEL
jgi:NAD+ synthase